ncbi:MAG: hypothetical protein NT070_09080 [Cyanobacteria bacterium]|nr:hypothetical protein [Cyanobacteriota bacterium]
MDSQNKPSLIQPPTSHYTRLVGSEEQKIYDHLLTAIQSESSDKILDRVRALLIEGSSYDDREVLLSLDRLVLSDSAFQDFQFVLNRCIHIITNRWQSRPHCQSAVPQLISILESSPTTRIDLTRSKANRRLRDLTQQFRDTDQFQSLRRLSCVLEQNGTTLENQQPLRTLIHRYPYLYPHCLVSDGSSTEDQKSVRLLQEKMQHNYELNLSQFVTYQVRRSAVSHQRGDRELYPVANPTLLADSDLNKALKQFAGKTSDGCTHRDLAERFMIRSQYQQQTFKGFKGHLYEYLSDAVEPEYGRCQFNKQLHQTLGKILPESDRGEFNESLLLRTCSQLLNFLIVQSSNQPKHFVFVDLLSNLGPIGTTSLILKLVLICRKIKPYLEKRLSILFNHYECHTQGSVQWLVMAMEHLNIALSTNFGKLNLTLVNSLA